MTSHSWWSSHNCHAVVGADAVASLRSNDPVAAVVALVDCTSSTELVLAQTAGADIVLAVENALAIDVPDGHEPEVPGLALAVMAATTIAQRRNDLAATSRRAGHDVAEALNVIGLISEAAASGRIDHTTAFTRIHDLVQQAGDDAWRAGRTHRASSIVVGCVDLRRVLAAPTNQEAAADVEVALPEDDVHVFADEQWLSDAIDELLVNARRAGATNMAVEVAMADGGEAVEIAVFDDGSGFDGVRVGEPFVAPASSGRLGLGLASIAERAAELGGGLDVVDSGGADGLGTCVRLTLPRIDPALLESDRSPRPDRSRRPAALSAPMELSGAQADILEGVVRHAPLDESLEGIVAAIERQLPGTTCSILLLHDGRCLHHGAGARLPLDYRKAIDGVRIGPGQGSCGTAAYTGRPVIASDVTTDHHWVDFRAIATTHGLRSCWSTPIVAAEGGETLGTFAVYTPTVWSPDQTAIRLVNRFTYLAAVAIEHRRLFDALAESEARFRSAFEGAAAGIALVTRDGVVLKSNPALSDVIGHPAARLPGTSLLDLIDPDPAHQELVTDSWAELTVGGNAPLDPVEVPLAHGRDGPTTWISVHTSLIAGDSERQPYLYVEVRDVTAARRQRADRRAREAAEAANRAKTDFLALASHELRTPLNAILGFAQVMQLLELDEDQRDDSVDHIVNAGRHLRDLIDELLDLSRIESGQLSAETRDVDAFALIDETIDIVGPLAAARNIDLACDLQGDRSPMVLADPRCMRQVMLNLLDNAVKYTPSGGRVSVEANGSLGSTVRIEVSDSGPGISPDSLDEIFQPFHRLGRVADGESEGTGLGLALCARLMREMKGSIGVDSIVGSGSTFWIDFPAAAS